MSKIAAPKGFEDILPAESRKWQAIEAKARHLAELYHFHEIRTPIVEHSELFHRGVGETTDIVHKETFTFQDRGGESMTLRPEGTAGVVRAMVEHNLLAQEGSRAKVYYIAPNFRYERPQKGRLRQHHQFGAEAFGVPEADQDVECILLQMDFYTAAGIKDLSLQVNSLGDAESKKRYKNVILEKLTPVAENLSAESQRRLKENPLRILDSKDFNDQAICARLPAVTDCLSERSRRHFERVCMLLQRFGIRFKIDNHLVRGFDYYTETIWEVTAPGLGAQNALGGGGRYDNLVEQLGGRPTPGVGFGSGLERLLIALEAQQSQFPIPSGRLNWLAYHGDAARHAQWDLLRQLRGAGFSADMDHFGRGLKAQFKLADRYDAARVIMIGDRELENETVTVKDLETGIETSIGRAEVIPYLRAIEPARG
jgi:histidyl-tRNA synthetase